MAPTRSDNPGRQRYRPTVATGDRCEPARTGRRTRSIADRPLSSLCEHCSVNGWREHDWDEVLGYGLEVVDGTYALLAVALLGVLVGFGAAVLFDIPYWLGVVGGGFLLPVLMFLLIWGVRREDERIWGRTRRRHRAVPARTQALLIPLSRG